MASNGPPIVQRTVQDAVGKDRGEEHELEDLRGFRRAHLFDMSPRRCSVSGAACGSPPDRSFT
jgi:hypothetical protein